jgi:hypothetical protein
VKKSNEKEGTMMFLKSQELVKMEFILRNLNGKENQIKS